MEYGLEMLVILIKDENEHDNNDENDDDDEDGDDDDNVDGYNYVNNDDNYFLCPTANYTFILYLQLLKVHVLFKEFPVQVKVFFLNF